MAKAKPAPYFTYEIIKKYALRKGVTIILDFEDETQEAQMGNAYSYEKKDKILTIVISKLIDKDRELVLQLIKKVHESGGLIWKDTKRDILKNYTAYSEGNKNQTTLEFFKEILNPDDYSALKMALYIKSEMQAGRPVHSYKRDIRDRFGERGANIANLCSAGYFEGEFIEFYNKYTQEEFFEYYEMAVGKKARALFVHTGMDYSQIEEEFNKMLGKAFLYHMKDFRVHGLGVLNVTNIKEFFSQKSVNSEDKFIFKKRYEKDTPVNVIEYVVTILEN